MDSVYFSRPSPPLFQLRKRKKRLYSCLSNFIFFFLILLLLVVSGYILFQSGSLAKIKNQLIAYRNQYNPDVQETPLPKTKNLTTEIRNVILPKKIEDQGSQTQFINKITPRIKSPTLVLLTSLDDLDNSKNLDVITSKKDWQLLNNQIATDNLLINQLIEENLLIEAPIELDHQLKIILEDFKDDLPDLQLVPLFISANTNQEKLDQVAQSLMKNCQEKCLFVTVGNWQSNFDPVIAEFHQASLISDLTALKLDQIKQNSTLIDNYLLYETVQLASQQKAQYFHLEDSSSLLSYFSLNPTDRTEQEKNTTFLFAGDMMFDRLVNHRFKDERLILVFQNINPAIFQGFDLKIANLEGPISDQPIEDDISPNNLSFNFPPRTPEVLNYLHLDAVSLANNHTLNAGFKGFEVTKKVLEKADISYFGHQKEFGNFSLYQAEDGDIEISVIGVSLLDNRPEIAITEAIKKEKVKGQFVIIFPHWGNEYQTKHNRDQEKLANDWIKAGADLIIGSHPHVVQDAQIIEGKPVFYSLGNFVFDQTFSQETQRGLILAGKITKNQIILAPLPAQSINLQPRLLSGEEKTKMINNLIQDLDFNPNQGIITINREID